ncbi:uncharacterized protein LOC143518224 [Brachyhypopomus gauderio]|uniref:uncharacterized protein LOC143518224 n=1 Tax=Brachyhypopomus gauderio TaxID=698409 RepID=UPI004043752A
MPTNPAVMRNLVIVVIIAFTTWTITDAQKITPCCTKVSTAKLTESIIGFRLQKKNLPCITAVIFETERGHFCVDPRQRWVQEKVMELRSAKKNNVSTTLPPSPSRAVSPRLITSTPRG